MDTAQSAKCVAAVSQLSQNMIMTVSWRKPRSVYPKIKSARRQTKEATMAEWNRNGFSARLRRLPGQLLLALVNATVILVIVATILVLVAVNRINHFAENIVSTMTG